MRRFAKLFLSDERGGPLAEFMLVIGLLFVVAIFVFEISRFYMRTAMAEYATHLAARTAAVRPAICPGVPETNQRAGGSTVRFGTRCSALTPSPCQAVSLTCTGVAGDPVSDEIFALVQPLLPNGATPGDLRFSYQASGLGFLGGPYIPIVAVSLENLQHDFILPLGQLFAPWSSGGGGSGSVPLGPLTATLPGEDLNAGTGG